MIEYIKDNIKNLEGTFHLKSEAFANAIIKAVKEKKIKKGEILPTVNSAEKSLSISRKTIVSGYNLLKERGIVATRERLGYYIASEDVTTKTNVLIILSSFSPYLQVFFNSLEQKLNRKVRLELSFHHANHRTLQSILKGNIEQYDKILLSGFNHPMVKKIIKNIPEEKLVIISRDDGCGTRQNFYIQDFHKGTLEALNKASKGIVKYKKFCLLFNMNDLNFPEGIINASEEFCHQHKLSFSKADNYKEIKSVSDTVFFVIDDNDLVGILEKIENEGLVPGRDAGIISYNDTPVKRVIRQGIDTISTNFEKMGELVAISIIKNESNQSIIETEYIKRNSL